ncbi:hypothetical protein F0562_003483 [Nyssa sinensis]|uniref:Uncharacterized protein n=1 Tax=Nyssa sinensis TaxID=561372 RepID=A0A5J5BWM3_9ASTE|nr:hypothetical protein F0562_003483 [Nyssa sinensis]
MELESDQTNQIFREHGTYYDPIVVSSDDDDDDDDNDEDDDNSYYGFEEVSGPDNTSSGNIPVMSGIVDEYYSDNDGLVVLDPEMPLFKDFVDLTFPSQHRDTYFVGSESGRPEGHANDEEMVKFSMPCEWNVEDNVVLKDTTPSTVQMIYNSTDKLDQTFENIPIPDFKRSRVTMSTGIDNVMGLYSSSSMDNEYDESLALMLASQELAPDFSAFSYLEPTQLQPEPLAVAMPPSLPISTSNDIIQRCDQYLNYAHIEGPLDDWVSTGVEEGEQKDDAETKE